MHAERRNTRSLSSGARSRDPVAIAPYGLEQFAEDARRPQK
jgi:hypothetical protein